MLNRRPIHPALVICMLGVLLAPALSSAECADPQAPALLWSYPAKNQTDVPTNAVILLLTTRDHAVAVSLNEAPVTVSSDGRLAGLRFDPGTLEPDTDYKLLVEIGSGPTTKKVQVQFTTGSGAAEAAAEPSIDAGEATDEPQDGICSLVAEAQTCDLDASSRRLVAPAAPAIAWLVEDGAGGSLLWPGDCTPEAAVASGAAADGSACVSISAVAGDGTVSAAANICPWAESTGEGDDASGTGGRGVASSCTTAGGTSPGPAALALLLGLLVALRAAGRCHPAS